jgi:hypothetical protein
VHAEGVRRHARHATAPVRALEQRACMQGARVFSNCPLHMTWMQGGSQRDPVLHNLSSSVGSQCYKERATAMWRGVQDNGMTYEGQLLEKLMEQHCSMVTHRVCQRCTAAQACRGSRPAQATAGGRCCGRSCTARRRALPGAGGVCQNVLSWRQGGAPARWHHTAAPSTTCGLFMHVHASGTCRTSCLSSCSAMQILRPGMTTYAQHVRPAHRSCPKTNRSKAYVLAAQSRPGIALSWQTHNS